MITLNDNYNKFFNSTTGQVFMNGKKLITYYKEVQDWELDADKGNFRLDVLFTPNLSKFVYFASKEDMKAYLEERANYNSII